MSKMPAKKSTSTKRDSSPTKKLASKPVKSTQQVNMTRTTDEKQKEKTNEMLAIAVDKSEIKTVKFVKMKEVIPKEMEKLEDLTKWPIIMDEVGE
jgi:phenylacetate-coenzyme A ligase PaaK-like adenylate-forming protein